MKKEGSSTEICGIIPIPYRLLAELSFFPDRSVPNPVEFFYYTLERAKSFSGVAIAFACRIKPEHI
jgi:hypothetical protein